MTTSQSIQVGARVQLRHDVDRYPHFIALSGSAGTVVEATDEMVCVLMDNDLGPGAAEWDNEIHWYPPNGDDPTADLA